jgi:hypothetical protein
VKNSKDTQVKRLFAAAEGQIIASTNCDSVADLMRAVTNAVVAIGQNLPIYIIVTDDDYTIRRLKEAPELVLDRGEALNEQLRLLSERAQVASPADLPGITHAVVEICTTFQRR